MQGVPVLATGFGGQASLTSRTAMGLIDYEFTASESHLGLADSVWVEPSVEHLANLMKTWSIAPPHFLQQLAKQAQVDYRYPLSWLDVVQSTKTAVQKVCDQSVSELPQIAWVSTWNSPCGIATYSQNLTRAFYRERLKIYANSDAQIVDVDEAHVLRTWVRGQNNYGDLAKEILLQGAQIAIIQSQSGLMSLSGLCTLLADLQSAKVMTYVTLHNTYDWFGPQAPHLSAIHRQILTQVTRLLVHTLEDLNRLKQAGFVANVTYFPHGIYDSPKEEAITSREYWGIPKTSPVIASFGFLMPHKGQQVLLEALAQLPAPYDQTHLLMLNTVLPDPVSQGEWVACQEKIQDFGLGGRVHAELNFLPESLALRHLALADAIIFPYQHTEESASGAVRMGLATRRPVIVTPLAIFKDVSRVSYQLAGFDASAIQNGLIHVLAGIAHKAPQASYAIEAEQMLRARNWSSLSLRLKNMVEGESLDIFDYQIMVSPS